MLCPPWRAPCAPAVPPLRPAALAVVCGAFGDGKRRRPKQTSPPPAAPAETPPPPPPPPPRVDPNSLMPVRHQIRFVREVRERERQAFRQASKPPPAAFRREAPAPEERRAARAAAAAAAAAASAHESKNFALSRLYATAEAKTGAPPPVLLVDGWNVAHAWPAAAPLLAAADLAGARALLEEALGAYSAVRGVRVTVAWDAQGYAGGGAAAGGVEAATRSDGVGVATCGDREADTFIEAAVGERLAAGHPLVVVATSDGDHADAVRAARPAAPGQVVRVVPASGLLGDMRRAAAEHAAYLAERSALAGFRPLGSALARREASGLNDLRLRLHRAAVEEAAAARRARRRRAGEPPSGGESSGGESSGDEEASSSGSDEVGNSGAHSGIANEPQH